MIGVARQALAAAVDADGLARPAKVGQVLVDEHGAPSGVKAAVAAVDEMLEEDSTLKKSTVYRRIAFMKKEEIIKDDKKN